MILMTQFVPNFYYPVFIDFREVVYRVTEQEVLTRDILLQ